jgi:glycosyltransferase involved in cell wall biosynthesis
MSRQVPRIAVLADWWWPETVGGAERSARGAALRLADSAEVAVFVPAAVEKFYRDGPLAVHAVRRPFARRVHADSALRRGLEFLTAWLLPLVAWRVAARIRDFGPDLVVATNVSRTGPWLIRWAKRQRVGFVRSYHDLSDTCWRRSRLKGEQNCLRVCRECRAKTWLMRRATPDSAVSVCVSRFVQSELVDAGLTTPDRSIVGYPVMATGGAAAPPARPAPREGTAIGYIGRLDPVKGVDSAIRVAAAYRRETGRPVSMVIAGEGHDDYLRALGELAARERIAVEFAGSMEVTEFCDRVDAVLIPSTWLEPFGRVAVEVGTRGLPMLISPVGGLPEAAAVSGGRYAFGDFRDPAAAARALAGLLEPARPDAATVHGGVAGAMPFERGISAAAERVLAGRPGEPAEVPR